VCPTIYPEFRLFLPIFSSNLSAQERKLTESRGFPSLLGAIHISRIQTRFSLLTRLTKTQVIDFITLAPSNN
jgi:hypothetical protein